LKKLKPSFEFEIQHITETDFEFDDVLDFGGLSGVVAWPQEHISNNNILQL
jgi:hypothetical protein